MTGRRRSISALQRVMADRCPFLRGSRGTGRLLIDFVDTTTSTPALLIRQPIDGGVSITGGPTAKSFSTVFAAAYDRIAEQRVTPGNLYAPNPTPRTSPNSSFVTRATTRSSSATLTPGARLPEDSSGLTRALAGQIGPFFYRYAPPGSCNPRPPAPPPRSIRLTPATSRPAWAGPRHRRRARTPSRTPGRGPRRPPQGSASPCGGRLPRCTAPTSRAGTGRQPVAAVSAPRALAWVRQSVWLGLVPAQRWPRALRELRSRAHSVSACFWM
jgi:hypothetical protein